MCVSAVAHVVVVVAIIIAVVVVVDVRHLMASHGLVFAVNLEHFLCRTK